MTPGMQGGTAKLKAAAAAALGVVLCAGAAMVQAQTFPVKPVTVIIPVASGGGADFVMRLIAQPLGARMGQQVLVDNRAGAEGSIGYSAGAKAAPDGYTLTMLLANLTLNTALSDDLPYKLSDFAAISKLLQYYYTVLGSAQLKAANLTELVAISKATPGGLKFGSSGLSIRLMMSEFERITGAKFTYVPYKGAGPARTDLLSGVLDVMVETTTGPLPYLGTGKLKVLGVSSPQRMDIFPGAQTFAEASPGLEGSAWMGLAGPAAMPRDRVTRFAREIEAVQKMPEIEKKLLELHFVSGPGTPESFAAFLQGERDQLRRVIKESGVKLSDY